MSSRDRNEKKIHADNIRRTNNIRIGLASKEKPTEKVKEYFRRKPYGKSEQTNADGKKEGNDKC